MSVLNDILLAMPLSGFDHMTCAGSLSDCKCSNSTSTSVPAIYISAHI